MQRNRGYSFAEIHNLSPKHVEAYIKFLQENKISDVMKGLLSIYFTAINDEYFKMSEMEKVYFEHTLVFLTDHADEKMCKFN